MVVRFVDDASGADVGALRPFDHDELAGVLGLDVATATDYYQRVRGEYRSSLNSIQGVSIARVLTRVGAVSAHVTHVSITSTSPPFQLDASTGDLIAASYLDSHPPVFSPVASSTDITFVLNPRVPSTGRGGIADDGGYVTAGDGQTITATVHLDGALLSPVVSGLPATVPAEQPVDVTAGLADGSDPGRYGWTWDFGDGGTATGSSATYSFPEPGTYTVQVAAEGTGADRSSGLSAPVTIQVTPAGAPPTTTPPPSSSPSPSVQPSLGNGGPSGPNGGPVAGSGPRVGGVATSRAGGGPPGPSFDPRSSAAPATGASSGPSDGQLVGYLLAGSTAGVPHAAQAAASPFDDAAPAARSGVGPGRLGWLAGVLAVVALLVLGAGTERRRPAHVRRTRLPTRRAR